MKPITILLVDDHKLVRESWAILLSADSRFWVIGEADSGEEAIRIAKRKKPAVVLMDINMQPMDGFATTRSIRSWSSNSEIIGVSMHALSLYAKKLFECGAKGYVTKNSSMEEMFEAILQVSQGHKYICDDIRNIMALQLVDRNDNDATAINRLTQREMEISKLITTGHSSKEIAHQFGVSAKTVEAHRYHILKKLNVNNRAALVNLINMNGI